jgi:hypothetical protein
MSFVKRATGIVAFAMCTAGCHCEQRGNMVAAVKVETKKNPRKQGSNAKRIMNVDDKSLTFKFNYISEG